MAITLRNATPADAARVTACVRAAYAPWVARIGREPGPMTQDYGQVIAGGGVYLAEWGGQLAGVLVLRTTDEGLLLENMAVAPTFQNRGIGHFLLNSAERHARDQGHASLYLYTHERMRENIARYERAGYVEYARRVEDGFPRVYLRKVLA
ncbi:GNAT family N-acetyltransferase [Pseudomonas mangiferae]|uniref:GNAT family N-acetyltransferase n=1 Tax=Pseudomonas mangiferae TaxID=2593654 RepID=A0A553GWS4_9PSED|nr:GNAT family N-acetyltransferase [Pseudomonas mangiferae]TRX73958.1 GNAT family N-acetyltransferase [Pseudomonas mangiferae]